jgi:Ser/Thr protein kinase RdoA (MazF antagonist)
MGKALATLHLALKKYPLKRHNAHGLNGGRQKLKKHALK